MNKKLLLVIGIIIGTGLILLIFVLLKIFKIQSPTTTPGTHGTSTTTFPTPGPGTNPTDTLSIRTKNGESIQTKDFLKDPDTVKDSTNAGYYSLGNHFSQNATTSPPYVIDFIDATDFFNIGLFKEPIAQSRKAAEQYLMVHLGISQSQMCELQYMVSVPTRVNEFYSIMNLGFSFCPGSVAIPE